MIRLSPLLAIALLAGCTAAHYDDPVARMSDPAEGHVVRWAAARQAQREMPDSPKRLAALREMVWQRGHGTEFRTYAIDQLLIHDEADTRAFLADRLPLIHDWGTYAHIANLAVKGNWTDLTAPLVRRYAIRSPLYRDIDRPERKTLESLNPGRSVEQIIFDVFADPNDRISITQRAAAWQLLCRLIDHEKLIAQLNGLQATNPLVADLQAAGRDLHVTADNMETLAWLQTLGTEPYAGFRRSAAAAVAKLNDEQRIGLELRHLPLIVRAVQTNDPALAMSRAQLLDEVRLFVASQDHHLKGPNFDGPMENHPQELYDWQNQVSWGDLLTLRAIIGLMRDPAIVRQFFAQADADHNDTSTEYGGLVVWNDAGAAYPKLYKPMMRRHDRAYYAPKEVITDAYTAMIHYHFHVHEIRNRAYAGAGMGDMERMGDTYQLSAIVLTSIEEGVLNIDFYRHDGVVIDLGVIRR